MNVRSSFLDGIKKLKIKELRPKILIFPKKTVGFCFNYKYNRTNKKSLIDFFVSLRPVKLKKSHKHQKIK